MQRREPGGAHGGAGAGRDQRGDDYRQWRESAEYPDSGRWSSPVCNDDAVVHDMSSDDHPSHLKCPALNQVGFLSLGQSRETGNFVTVQTCGFHDHLDAQNPGLLGTINIVE